MTTIYMVRHAESPYMDGSERTRGLSVEGKKKARQVADLLINEGINLIVSSPYARAKLTVEGLAHKLNLDIIEIEDLRERHFAGDDYKISDEEFVPAVNRMFEDPSYALPGGESNLVCQNRAVAALKTLLIEHNGSKIAIGTHGNVMTLMIGYFDSSFGFDFLMQTDKPDVYKLEFEGLELKSVTRLWQALKV
ncbi:histidine phosphatase family protein [Paenibacillus harenae]|uniref:2,3-bisphosphoglycerate-dependent phosphoglycerate mutase n=1 Tax=Paenibacillus harenae TaxID=306543 RepID=A0ABT9U132_PAEHA|nr:histidine phosphatase family protein [Paenibacillus harenae]MDQ0112375.1 2,3-bisphosphoglycerate-dependent phosphoglycerate mutase [Paenibacillus harenae]